MIKLELPSPYTSYENILGILKMDSLRTRKIPKPGHKKLKFR